MTILDSTELAIAILGGGESRRMGRDKAKLDYQGTTFLEHLAGEALEVAPTAVLGRDDPEDFDLPEVDFVPDREPGLGPIGGLRTALEHFGRSVAAVGCDMPLVDAKSIRWLVDTFDREGSSTGLAVEIEGALQPLFAVYTPSLSALAAEMVEDGERSLRRLVRRANMAVREPPDRVAERLVNVNTPEEFRELAE